MQKFKTGQLVKAEEVQVSIVEKQKQIELQQQEILRKQRELEANVQKPADAERYRVETLANATKFQLETEAAGAASAAKAKGFAAADVVKATGLAEADANKARGLAEAAIIQAQGAATAEAMKLKADSFKQYNEAAVIEMIVRILPEVAGKISEPLSKTEKIVIINSGSGPGGGASKMTGDITQIISQLPPVIESLTGIKFEKLLEQVPALEKCHGEGAKNEGKQPPADISTIICVYSTPFSTPIIARSTATTAPAFTSADYAGELPVVALTCIDPRLNRFFPGVLGLPEEQFIWLRNAGNIITGRSAAPCAPSRWPAPSRADAKSPSSATPIAKSATPPSAN